MMRRSRSTWRSSNRSPVPCRASGRIGDGLRAGVSIAPRDAALRSGFSNVDPTWHYQHRARLAPRRWGSWPSAGRHYDRASSWRAREQQDNENPA